MFNFSLVKVFTTAGSEVLADKVCKSLESRLPEKLLLNRLGESNITRFSNENIQAQVEDVRDCFIVVIHTQAPPVNEGLIELFALLDAIANASPADLLLIFPYMPYSRSDRKNQPRISTMGHRLPNILTRSFGIKRALLLDPHDSHIKHYFYPAADEISAIYLMVDFLKKELKGISRENGVVVFCDAGSVNKYKSVAYNLGLPTAYIDKDRPDNNENPRLTRVIGEIKGKSCLLIDDEILTGETAIGDAEILKKEGADLIYMSAVHPILNNRKTSQAEVIKKLDQSSIERFIITDSIPQDPNILSPKFTVLSVASLLGEAIKRTVFGESLTELHRMENVNLYR